VRIIEPTDGLVRVSNREDVATTGKVTGWISMAGLATPDGHFVEGQGDVLNGIAYDAQGDRLFITGKKWPKLFEIKLVKKAAAQ